MKPILFNTEMTNAVREGRKTATRRVLKEPYYIDDEESSRVSGLAIHRGTNITYGMPYPDSPYEINEILYVPEAWKCIGTYGELGYEVEFRDGQRVSFKFEDRDRAKKWAKYRDKPSHQWQSPYFMPREAARLFLRVKDVRVERLQDVTEEQAEAEGAPRAFEYNTPEGPVIILDEDGYFYCGFKAVWESTIPKEKLPIYGWDANPWVWVIEFKRISKEKAEK